MDENMLDSGKMIYLMDKEHGHILMGANTLESGKKVYGTDKLLLHILMEKL